MCAYLGVNKQNYIYLLVWGCGSACVSGTCVELRKQNSIVKLCSMCFNLWSNLTVFPPSPPLLQSLSYSVEREFVLGSIGCSSVGFALSHVGFLSVMEKYLELG